MLIAIELDVPVQVVEEVVKRCKSLRLEVRHDGLKHGGYDVFSPKGERCGHLDD